MASAKRQHLAPPPLREELRAASRAFPQAGAARILDVSRAGRRRFARLKGDRAQPHDPIPVSNPFGGCTDGGVPRRGTLLCWAPMGQFKRWRRPLSGRQSAGGAVAPGRGRPPPLALGPLSGPAAGWGHLDSGIGFLRVRPRGEPAGAAGDGPRRFPRGVRPGRPGCTGAGRDPGGGRARCRRPRLPSVSQGQRRPSLRPLGPIRPERRSHRRHGVGGRGRVVRLPGAVPRPRRGSGGKPPSRPCAPRPGRSSSPSPRRTRSCGSSCR